MLRADKERIVSELGEKLQATESLIVADYRGLSNSELADLRTKLLENGARFTVVKNTLARRAAETAGAEDLLALIDGPTAIAFVEASGDTAAVAKVLVDTATKSKILSVRGGIMSGVAITDADVQSLAKLPPIDVLKGQLVGAIVAPLTALAALLAAPLRDVVGLIEARIAQLEEEGEDVREAEPAAEAEPAETEPTPEEPTAETAADDGQPEAEPAAEEQVEAEPPVEEPTAEAAPDESAAQAEEPEDTAPEAEPDVEAENTDSSETDSNEEE